MASTCYHTSAELRDEPSLEELFAEPIVQLIMQRDGIHAHEMREQLNRVMLPE